MVTTRRGITTTAIICAALIGLSGCAGAAEASGGDSAVVEGLTIADSKGATQLLRNLAVTGIPSELVAADATAEDTTSPCRTAEADPEELERFWKSTARVELVPDADAEAAVEDLTASFVAEGWDQGIYGSASITRLTRDDTTAAIHLSVNEGGDAGEGPKVQINVSGPCVMTGGPEGEDVQRAEGRWEEDE